MLGTKGCEGSEWVLPPFSFALSFALSFPFSHVVVLSLSHSLHHSPLAVSQRFAVGSKGVESLLREADVLSKLSHPFIVNLKDVFQTDATLYLVMVRGRRRKETKGTKREGTPGRFSPFLSHSSRCIFGGRQEWVAGGEMFNRLVERGGYREDRAKDVIARLMLVRVARTRPLSSSRPLVLTRPLVLSLVLFLTRSPTSFRSFVHSFIRCFIHSFCRRSRTCTRSGSCTGT